MRARPRALHALAAVAGDRRGGGTAPSGPRPALTPRVDSSALGALAIGLVALALYAASPFRDRFWASAIAISSFALAPALVPSVRARIDTPVCPLNYVLMLFL